jgi:cytochrome c biogenesis protein CcdA/glutaredoxin-related protein
MQKTIFRLFSALLLLLILSFPVLAYAQDPALRLDFFYGEGCAHCAKVSPFIEELEKKYNFISVERIETYHNLSNGERLMQAFDRFNIAPGERGVPTVVFHNQIFIGEDEIFHQLEKSIIATGGTSNSNSTSPFSEQRQTGTQNFWSYFWVILGPAFVDSINPCAIAVLVILLGALMMQEDKKRALWGGLAFTLSIYITYFLFGLGLTHMIKISGASLWIYKIIGLLAIIIGLANLKDAFWYGKGGFVMEIPLSWRPRLKKMLHAVTSPIGAFLIGFIVTLFELPCTGGPYFFVIGLLANKMTYATIIPLLLIYNVVFVLPLLLITFIIYGGLATVQRAEQWKDKNMKQLHLISGIIMLLLGIWVFYN